MTSSWHVNTKLAPRWAKPSRHLPDANWYLGPLLLTWFKFQLRMDITVLYMEKTWKHISGHWHRVNANYERIGELVGDPFRTEVLSEIQGLSDFPWNGDVAIILILYLVNNSAFGTWYNRRLTCAYYAIFRPRVVPRTGKWRPARSLHWRHNERDQHQKLRVTGHFRFYIYFKDLNTH